jgi:hypothetical protein
MDLIDLFARSPVVGAVVLSALLFFGLLGATKLWRRKRKVDPPEETGTRFTSAPDLAIVLIGLLVLALVVGQVMRFLD